MSFIYVPHPSFVGDNVAGQSKVGSRYACIVHPKDIVVCMYGTCLKIDAVIQ